MLNIGHASPRRASSSWLEDVCHKLAGNRTGMCVTWLGTSSGAPSSSRNITSIALRIGDPETIILVDAGEGTQYQVSSFGLDVTAIKQVFITHHHGDHIFGLPGVIAARNEAFAAKGLPAEPLAIYGPPGTADVVIMCISLGLQALAITAPCAQLSIVEWCLTPEDAMAPTVIEGTRGLLTVSRQPPDQSRPDWAGPKDVNVVAMSKEPGDHSTRVPVCDGLTWTVAGAAGLRVQAAQLHHRVPCWGYVFQEPTTKANAAAGGGRKVVLLGDTHNSAPILRLAQGADVLSHEATFLSEMSEKARIATHSTGAMAGAFAHAIQAQQLVLTHFSGRYGHGRDPHAKPLSGEDEERQAQMDLRMLKREAERAMRSNNVVCAYDGFTYRL